MTESDLLLMGFKKVSTRDKGNVSLVVGIRFAYQKGSLTLYPQKNESYVYIDAEGVSHTLYHSNDLKKLLENSPVLKAG